MLFIKKIFSGKINLARDWKILVSAFAFGLALISIFAWHIYLSNQIGGGYFKTEALSADSATQIVNKERLQKDLSILENRQADFQKIKASQVKLIDPAL